MGRVYGQWGGNKKGVPEEIEQCVEALYDRYISRQCSKKRGHGENELYCKQHAKKKERYLQAYFLSTLRPIRRRSDEA